MSNTKTIQPPALRGMLAGHIAGIITGLIGGIFFREFWLAIAKATTKQIAAIPFWLSILLGGFLGGILGLVIARRIGRKQIPILTVIGIAIGVVLAWNNVVVRILKAILAALSGTDAGLTLLVILGFAIMLITNALILAIPGRVLGTLIGTIFKFRGLLIVWGIVSTVLLLSMWRISILFSLGLAGSGFTGALVGIFIGMIGTNSAVTRIYENNREGGTIDRLFGEKEKGQTVEEREMAMIIISVISLIGGIVGAILGGLGWLSF